MLFIKLPDERMKNQYVNANSITYFRYNPKEDATCINTVDGATVSVNHDITGQLAKIIKAANNGSCSIIT